MLAPADIPPTMKPLLKSASMRSALDAVYEVSDSPFDQPWSYRTHPFHSIIAIVNRNRKLKLGSKPVINIHTHATILFTKLPTQQRLVVQASKTKATSMKHYQRWSALTVSSLVYSDRDLGAVAGIDLVVCFLYIAC